ncbi:MAG: tolC 1 [Anaerosporomusa subterranea]|jgi:TolC family type I secretion outer membrane protein|nr:tolC 1 [Anaerosporomusa subterranea]
MALNTLWSRRLASALVGGCLLLNTAFAATAPYELTLDESIRLALANNPAIKVAEADKEKAAWTVKEAQAGKAPTLSLGHTSSRSHSDLKDSTGNNFENGISLSLPLYTGGKVESAIEQAKLGNDSAALGLENTKQQIRLDATSAYYNVLQASNMVKLNQESVDRLNAHVKNVQAQYQVGTVAKTDVLRSEVEVADAEQNLIKAENSYELSIANLNNVVGMPLETQINVKDQLKYEQVSLTLEQAIKQAMVNRPDLAQAELSVAVAEEGVNGAKSGYRPTIGVSASEGWDDTKFPGTDNNTWSVGVKASWNIFDSGLTNSQVRQSQASLEKARQQQQQAKDAAQLEVRQAFLNLKEAEKRIATSQVAVNKAEEDYKIAQVRYTSGVGTNLDVIDSQVALTQAKTNYIQSLYDYNTSRAKLEKAIGAKVQ